MSIESVVDLDAGPDEAAELAKRVTAELLGRGIIVPARERPGCARHFAPGPHAGEVVDAINQNWSTGLNVTTGRTVFDPGENGLETLYCPACGGEAREAEVDWSAAVVEWSDGSGPALLPCPRCFLASPIQRWTFHPTRALGQLGFEFYEWFLRPEFVRQIGLWLGHRVALVSCHR